MVKLYPGVAQLVARMVRVHEAVGSTPATRTSKKCCNLSDYSTFPFCIKKTTGNAGGSKKL